MQSDKKRECTKRHLSKMERINIWCKPEEKEAIKADAAKAGKSLQAYIMDALEQVRE